MPRKNVMCSTTDSIRARVRITCDVSMASEYTLNAIGHIFI